MVRLDYEHIDYDLTIKARRKSDNMYGIIGFHNKIGYWDFVWKDENEEMQLESSNMYCHIIEKFDFFKEETKKGFFDGYKPNYYFKNPTDKSIDDSLYTSKKSDRGR